MNFVQSFEIPAKSGNLDFVVYSILCGIPPFPSATFHWELRVTLHHKHKHRDTISSKYNFIQKFNFIQKYKFPSATFCRCSPWAPKSRSLLLLKENLLKRKRISSQFLKFLKKLNWSTNKLAFFKYARHDGARYIKKSCYIFQNKKKKKMHIFRSSQLAFFKLARHDGATFKFARWRNILCSTE